MPIHSPGSFRSLLALSGLLAIAARGQGEMDPDWIVHVPQPTSQTLLDASFLSPQLGLAVGQGGAILRTQDAGDTWVPQRSPSQHNLNRVHFQDRLRALAVGDSGTVLRSVDGGLTWVRQALGASGTFTSIHFHTPDQGNLLRSDGTVYSTRDGGATWTQLPGDSMAGMREIQFLDSLVGFMVGARNFYRTEDGGKTWSAVHLGGSFYPTDVHFVSPEIGFISGHLGMEGVLRTSNGGQDWTYTSLPDAGTLRFFDTRHGYALGTYGLAGETRDGGLTWTRPTRRSPVHAMRCFFTEPQSGFGFAELGVIYRTRDGGARWLQRVESRMPGFSALHFTPEGIGYGWGEIPLAENHREPDSAAYDLFKSSDLGKTWTRLGVTAPAFAYDLQFTTPDIGLSVGDSGKIWRTADGGKTWSLRSRATSLPLHEIHCPARDTCFAVGGHMEEPGILLKSVDGGMTWNLLASPARNALLSVHFVSGRKGFVTFVDGILVTRDGGLSWNQVATSDQGAWQYISFTDPVNGHAMSIDSLSFLLKTSDGGETWIRLPAPDGTFAAAFVNADTGFAAGTKMDGTGFVAKTGDGGRTWSSPQVFPFPLHRIYLPAPGEGFALNVHGAMVRQSGEATVGIRRRTAPRASAAVLNAEFDAAGRKLRKAKRTF